MVQYSADRRVVPGGTWHESDREPYHVSAKTLSDTVCTLFLVPIGGPFRVKLLTDGLELYDLVAEQMGIYISDAHNTRARTSTKP